MLDTHGTPAEEDRALNDAIRRLDISLDFSPFVELCRRHYADQVDLTLGATPRRTVAREALEGMLLEYLIPIHMITEIGGVRAAIDIRSLPSDSFEEQRSSWSAELLAKNGTRHTISWKTTRIWIAGKVVAEHIYDQSHEGPPIQFSDLELKQFGPDYFPDHL